MGLEDLTRPHEVKLGCRGCRGRRRSCSTQLRRVCCRSSRPPTPHMVPSFILHTSTIYTANLCEPRPGLQQPSTQLPNATTRVSRLSMSRSKASPHSGVQGHVLESPSQPPFLSYQPAGGWRHSRLVSTRYRQPPSVRQALSASSHRGYHACAAASSAGVARPGCWA
jgi:hypothetical protein